MHGSSALMMTLTVGLGLAVLLGYLAHRIRLSPIVGYLLAGIIVSSHTPGYVADQKIADQFAEIGVILLMFGVGLEFHFRELLAVRRVAVPGAVLQSLLTTLAVAVFMHTVGYSWAAGAVAGLSVSVASTVVLIRVLADHRDLHTPAGHIAVGWLVVEDLFTVLILVVLPAIFGNAVGNTGAESGGLADVVTTAESVESTVSTVNAMAGTSWNSLVSAIGMSVLKVGLLVAIAFLIGTRVIPVMLERIAKTRSRELFTLAVLFCALGLAVASSLFFDVSPALGAFFAGMIVGRSEYSFRAAADAIPMRDAFAVLFFISVGMMFNPAQLFDSPGVLTLLLAVVMIGKPLASFPILFLMRYPLRTTLTVCVALAQIGEFSFILASLGGLLGIIPDSVNNAIIAAAVLSITLNPLLYEAIGPFERWVNRHGRWKKLLVRGPGKGGVAMTDCSTPDEMYPLEESHRVVIVGYGPVGQTVVRILRENQMEPVVIEMNPTTAKQLREEGIRVVHGDASREATLRGAQIQKVRTLILSSDAALHTPEIIRLTRELNPEIRILARVHYVNQRDAILAVGANAVFSGEAELAMVFAETLLRELGATDSQIDSERHRVHDEMKRYTPFR